MAAVDELVNAIYEINNIANSNKGDTCLCEIVSKVDSVHYDVYALPDRSTVIKNIPNMTRFDFNVGDYCYIYKISNNMSLAFICFKLLNGNTDVEAQTTDNFDLINKSIKTINQNVNSISNDISDIRDVTKFLKSIPGYDGTKVQTLKQKNNSIYWDVDDKI